MKKKINNNGTADIAVEQGDDPSTIEPIEQAAEALETEVELRSPDSTGRERENVRERKRKRERKKKSKMFLINYLTKINIFVLGIFKNDNCCNIWTLHHRTRLVLKQIIWT